MTPVGRHDPGLLDRVRARVDAGASWTEAVVAEGRPKGTKDAIRKAVGRRLSRARGDIKSVPSAENPTPPVTVPSARELAVTAPSLQGTDGSPAPASVSPRPEPSESALGRAELAERVRILEAAKGGLLAGVDAALGDLQTRVRGLEAVCLAPTPVLPDFTSIWFELDRLRAVVLALAVFGSREEAVREPSAVAIRHFIRAELGWEGSGK